MLSEHCGKEMYIPDWTTISTRADLAVPTTLVAEQR